MSSIEKPYCDALKSGNYNRKSGLNGKYDNVRHYWEDEITRAFLAPLIKKTLDIKSAANKGLRILDIGCGSGDGYELVMGITNQESNLYDTNNRLIKYSDLNAYLGIDINKDLIDQARLDYIDNEKTRFIVKDFSSNNFLKDLEPFDLYLTSYGTLSHNSDKETIKLLTEIALHCNNYAIIVCDWLGRYSYEWQQLWSNNLEDDLFIDYRMSYIYNRQQNKTPIQSFPLRIMSDREVLNIVNTARSLTGINITVKKLFDRSIFVGRHIDTNEYNKHCQPLRKLVNTLLEPNIRTDLHALVVNYEAKENVNCLNDFSCLNDFFKKFSHNWNSIVNRCINRLYGDRGPKRRKSENGVNINHLTAAIDKVINISDNALFDARANIIEQQLAHCLRQLEMQMQPGIGIGHGLVSILEIDKKCENSKNIA
ncbi:Methyltransferase type 12 [Candidatus Magnetoovum chiemensis]|nr:Methyltransferase type 12 [Candidatus Magnetoovum chiemensis]